MYKTVTDQRKGIFLLRNVMSEDLAIFFLWHGVFWWLWRGKEGPHLHLLPGWNVLLGRGDEWQGDAILLKSIPFSHVISRPMMSSPFEDFSIIYPQPERRAEDWESKHLCGSCKVCHTHCLPNKLTSPDPELPQMFILSIGQLIN